MAAADLEDVFRRGRAHPFGPAVVLVAVEVEDRERLKAGGETLDRLQRVGKDADHVTPGVVEFCRAWRFGAHPFHFLDGLPAGGARDFVGHRGRDDEGTGAATEGERARDAVGVAVLLPECEVQAAHELAPEDGVRHLEPDAVGVTSSYAGMPDPQFGLRGAGPVDDHDAAPRWRGRLGFEALRGGVEMAAVRPELRFDRVLDRPAHAAGPEIADGDQVA